MYKRQGLAGFGSRRSGVAAVQCVRRKWNPETYADAAAEWLGEFTALAYHAQCQFRCRAPGLGGNRGACPGTARSSGCSHQQRMRRDGFRAALRHLRRRFLVGFDRCTGAGQRAQELFRLLPVCIGLDQICLGGEYFRLRQVAVDAGQVAGLVATPYRGLQRTRGFQAACRQRPGIARRRQCCLLYTSPSPRD